MNRTSLPLLVVLALAACATLRGSDDTETLYREGLDSLARREFASAALSLQHISRSGPADLAQRARVLVAVAELDPANPARRLDAADDLAETLRGPEAQPTFEQVVAATLERMAREVKDLQSGMTAAQTQRDSAFATIDSLHVHADSMVAVRDSVKRRNQQLETRVDELTKENEKLNQEIERMKRAIRR
jgi:Basic region leucine zipper